MFERTRSGQQNRATFFGVDFVCYVEGGGGSGSNAADMTFWKSVLGTLRPNLTFRFIPRGGKPVLEKIAREVVLYDIQDTLVALDSDYDDFRNRKIIDRRILYSYGYSWENDVFSEENLGAIYTVICHCGSLPQQVATFLHQAFQNLKVALSKAVRADFFALCAGTSVLPREAPGRVIASDPANGLPVVRKIELLKLVRLANSDAKRGPVVGHTGQPADSGRHCVGHVLALAARILLKAAIQVHHRKLSLPPDHLRDVALLTFPALLMREPPDAMSAYYRHQCSAF